MAIKPVPGLLPQVYDLIKSGELERANRDLARLLQQDLENGEVLFSLTGVTFWIDKLKRAQEASTDFERGEYLISQWRPFTSYMEKTGAVYEVGMYALKHGACTLALQFYQSLYREDGTAQEAELYRKIGLCYKLLGDYDRALHLLEQAVNTERDSPAILAELGDCYALCGEVRLSKVYFREAFFQGANAVERHFLESEIIQRLISQVTALGYTGSVLAEWIPVYGVLYGVLNVKRELRALEFGKLKQAIFALENEIKDAAEEIRAILVPRLINHYFWLIDHYINVNDDKTRINEVLLKIKLLDTDVYNRYTM